METSLHGSQCAGPNAGRKHNLARLGGPRPVDGAPVHGAITGTMPERGPARHSCEDPPADRNNAQTERYASRSVIRQRWPLALCIETVLGSRFGTRLRAPIKKRLSTFQTSYTAGDGRMKLIGNSTSSLKLTSSHAVLSSNNFRSNRLFKACPDLWP